MQRLITTAIVLCFFGFSSAAQEQTESGVTGAPVTITEKPMTVKIKGSKYKYKDISITAIPGREDEISPADLKKYEPFAAMLRDSILFGHAKREAQKEMLASLAEAIKEGRVTQTNTAENFDITKVPWKNKAIAVDFFAGLSTSSPLGFLSAYTGPAFGGTVDLGLYFRNAFVRGSYGVGSGKITEGKGLEGVLNNGKNASKIELSLNLGYMIPIGDKMAVSPFVGAGKSGWNYKIGGSPCTYEGLAIAEGVEIMLFLHKTFTFSISDPNLNMPTVRLRIYSDQILNSIAKGPIPTINASLCFGFHHRNIGR